MINGELHFELANQDRISVPKDGTTFVTIKADIRNLTPDQVGKLLKLALDADGSSLSNAAALGIEAVTASTGADISTPTNGWGDAVSEEFVLNQ